jgi:pimeloyl-ACP methyl ester carboxylesterase
VIEEAFDLMAKFLKVIGAAVALILLLLFYNVARHLVFWGPTETVTFESGGTSLVGTLAKPRGSGLFPAVIVLLGSGPETRNGPGYRINAKNMLRHGFAVLIFDKRGSGDSGGDLDTATFADFAADAEAAVRYLASRDDIDGDAIGLLANSESGWYSAEVAADTRKVAFIINRVGPPLPWIDTVSWEVRNEFVDAGIAEADIESLLAVTERRWRFYAAAGKNPELAAGTERQAIDAEIARLRQSVPHADEVLPEKVRDYDPDFYRSYAIDATYDPDIYLRQIDIPLLYVFGGRDVNIPTARSVEYLELLKNDYRGTVDIRVYPKLGHPLATWRGVFHGGYPPDYLSFSGEWAQSQLSD